MDAYEVRKVITSGDEAGIEHLVHTYQADVFRLSYALLGDPQEANDVMQDTFVTAFNKINLFQENISFKAWLYTIALNLSRDRLRKRKTWDKLKNALGALLRIESQRPVSTEAAFEDDERTSRLRRAVNTLGEIHRTTIILLRYYQGLSINEIAEILNISAGTVHSRLFTAHRQLRAALTEHEYDSTDTR